MPADSQSVPPAVGNPGGSASTSVPAIPGSAGMPGDRASFSGTVTEDTSHGPADDQQDPSPSPDNHVKRQRFDNGADLFDHAAQDQMAATLQAFHDSLSLIDDVSCPMPKTAGSSAKVDMQNAAAPTPFTPAEGQVNGDAAVTKEASTEEETTTELKKADGETTIDFVTKENANTLIERAAKAAAEAVKAAYGEVVAELEGKVAEQQKEIDRLSAEPDPEKSAVRKAVLPATRPSFVNDAEDASYKAELLEKQAAYKTMAENSPDPLIRTYASRELDSITDIINKMV